jgi:hypothetical protein
MAVRGHADVLVARAILLLAKWVFMKSRTAESCVCGRGYWVKKWSGGRAMDWCPVVPLISLASSRDRMLGVAICREGAIPI